MKNSKKRANLSIKKATGTIKKVQSMIEQDKYCPEIIQQIDSVIGLLSSAKKNLLENHLKTCLEHKLKEDKRKAIEELIKIFDLKK